MLYSDIIPWMLSNALLVGLAAFAGGVLVRLFGRAVGLVILLVGLAATAYVGFGEWKTGVNASILLAIVLSGIALSVALGWLGRVASFVPALVLVGGGVYLLMYSWQGAAFYMATLGMAAYAAAVIATMAILERVYRYQRSKVPPSAAYPSPRRSDFYTRRERGF